MSNLPYIFSSLVLILFSIETTEGPHLLIKEINSIRTHGYLCGSDSLPVADTLIWSEKLAITAKQHAQDMHDDGYFSHYNRLNHDVGQRADSVHYEWNQIGENIAIGYLSDYDVMRAWLESPEHCEMIMYPHISEMGAARVGDYWVVNFGKPDSVLGLEQDK